MVTHIELPEPPRWEESASPVPTSWLPLRARVKLLVSQGRHAHGHGRRCRSVAGCMARPSLHL